MKSAINEEFLKTYRRLPKEVRERARASYRLFRDNPYHPSLQFKRLEGTNTYSVRIGRSYRAFGKLKNDTITWFWIGSHAEYDHLASGD